MYYLWNAPAQPVTVHLSHTAIARLKQLAGSVQGGTRGNEYGGILFGRVQDPDADRYSVSVEDARPVEAEHRRGQSYSLAESEHQAFARHLRPQRDGLQPVGYFRSHTRPGLYLDEYDAQLMEKYFKHPSSVALLVRPGANDTVQAGFFLWEGDELQRTHSPMEFELDPEIERAPAPGRSNARLRALCIGVTAAFLVFAVIAPFARPNRQPAQAAAPVPVARTSSLLATPVTSGLRVTWDPRTDHISQASTGVLWIGDGSGEKRIDLSPDDLRHGSLDYVPTSNDVNFRLEVNGVTDSVRAKVPIVVPTVGSEASTQAPPVLALRSRPAPQKSAALPEPRSAPIPSAELYTPPAIAVNTEVEKLREPVARSTPKPPSTVTSSVEEAKPNALRRAVGAVPGLRVFARDKRRGDDYEPPVPTRRIHPASSGKLDQRVSVRISVDVSGNVTQVDLLSKNVDEKPRNAAISAATKWRFQPAKEKGKPVPSDLVVHFDF